MKQKIKLVLLRAAVTVATIVGLAGTSITAYAHVDPADIEAEESEPVPEPQADDETEKMGPMTPDGNLTIVDDYGDPEKSGKQFITVTTKNGNIFYIIIDRDDKGENTVHFLNLVDERDILSLLDEDEIKELKGETDEEEVPVVTEEPKEDPAQEAESEPEPKKKGGSKVALIVIVLILAGSGGFYLYSNRDELIHKEKEDPDKDYQEDEEKNVLDNIPEEKENPEE